MNIRSGTYNEQISITSISGTNANQTVTFQKDPGTVGEVICTATGSSTKNYVWQLNSVNYLFIKNIRFKSLSTTYNRVFDFVVGSYTTIDSCYFENAIKSGTSTTNYGCFHSPNKLTYCTIKNSTFIGGAQGIKLIANTSAKGLGVLIENNTIDSTTKYGISVLYYDSVVVTKNTISDFPGNTNQYVAIEIEQCPSGVNVTKNRMTLVGKNRDNGIWMEYVHTFSTGANITNNMINFLDSGATHKLGINLYRSRNLNVAFNTVKLLGNGTHRCINRYDVLYSTVRNNITYTDGNAGFNTIGGTTTGSTASNNCQYKKGSGAGSGINVDPDFASELDLRATNSALKGQGVTISGITTDINDSVRTNPPGVGASIIVTLPALKGTYTIGAGTPSPDYSNFTAAVSALDSHGIRGPVIFNVRSGTYTEQITIDSIIGASATNTITFQKEPGASNKPLVQYSGFGIAPHTIQIDSADYITFKNLDVRSLSNSYGRPFFIKGITKGITIDSCHVKGVYNSLSSNAAIYFTGTGGGASDSATISNCTIDSCYTGIYFAGTAGGGKEVVGNRILNNTLTNYRNNGFQLLLQKNFECSGNTLVGAVNSIQQVGIDINYFSTNCSIVSNTVVNKTSSISGGIYIQNCSGSASESITVANNTYRNPNALTTSESGLFMSNSSNVGVYYNTISVKTSSTSGGNSIFINTGNSSITVKNNNFYNSGAGLAYLVQNTPSSFVTDYNNLYSNGAVLGKIGGTDRLSIGAWKTGTGQATNSQNFNPIFLSDSVLKPNNLDLNNMGVSIAGITTDILDSTRNASTPDIGAYEFTGVAPPCPLLSGSYTIGGTAPDYVTVQEAVDSLVSIGVCGPVVMNLRSGTYNEQITIDSIPGTDSTNTVKFRTESGAATKAIITNNISFIIKIDTGVSYVSFDSLELTSTTAGNVILFAGTNHHISFEGNDFSSNSNNSGNLVSDVPDVSTSDLSIIGNTFYNASGAIHLNGGDGSSSTSGDSGVVIKNNIIKNYKIWGISLSNYHNCLIEGNETEGSRPSGLIYGISYYNGSNIRIISNRILAVGAQGVPINISNIEGGPTSRSLIANNMFSGEGTQLSRSSFENLSNTDIVYNNFSGKTGSYGYAIVDLDINSTSTFQNNSVYGSGPEFAVTSRLTSTALMDYNNIYGNGGKSNVYDGVMGAHSISVNPLYVNDTNLTALAPDLVGRATSIASVTKDIDGVTRKSTPDIGVHDRVANPIDVRLVEVSVPQTCDGDSAQVSVLLRNLGSNSLASVNVNWKISTNNGSYVPQTTHSFSFNIPPFSDTLLALDKIALVANNEYEIVAYPHLPNGIADTINFSDTATLVAEAALSGGYTIGGATPDYPTINAAVTELIRKGICGPTTFNVRSATYNERISITDVIGSSATNRITFRKDPSALSKPIISYTNMAYDTNYIVQLKETDYITFDSLEFHSNDATYSTVAHVFGPNEGVEFLNCVFKGEAYTSSFYGRGFTTDSRAKNITIEGCEIIGGRYGIYMRGQSDAYTSGFKIKNSTITHFYGEGIYFRNIENFEIIGNTVIGGERNPTGIYLYNIGIAKINNNKVRTQGFGNSHVDGISLYYSSGDSLNPIEIYNNEVICNGDSVNYSSGGLSVSYTAWVNVFNNTVFASGNGNGTRTFSCTLDSGLVQVQNNNFIVNSNLSSSSAGQYYDFGGQLKSDYNNYFGTAGALVKYGGSYNTISSLSAAKQIDSNSVSIDPIFVSDTALVPTNLGFDSKGTPLAEITTDILDTLRSIAFPDIGAYEFGTKGPCVGLSGTYTIGGTSPYFATISEAVDSLNIKGVCDSVIFNIRQGTYTEQIEITEINNVSDSAIVIFQSDPSNTTNPNITYSATTLKPYTIMVNGSDYVQFRNIDITKTGGGIAAVFFDGVCENLEFDSCNVSANSGYSFYCDWQGTWSQTSEDLDGLVISYCIADRGINLQTNGPSSDSAIFSGNTINGPISLRVFNGTTFKDNDLNGVVGLSYSNTSWVESNKAEGLTSYRSGNQTIFNNEFRGPVYYSSTSNSTFYHNTVHNGSGFALNINGSSNNFRNNILSSNTYVVSLDSSTISTYDYNVYNSEIDTIAKYTTGTFATDLSEFQLLGRDSNSLVIDPRFRTDTSLVPRIADLETAGTPIAGITTDIRDSARSTTAPSIGAYEYTYVCDGLSGTYTIGGTSPDYTTISAAVADLNSLGICDDVTFNIRQGTYNEQTKINDIYNAGDSGMVVFQSDPSNTLDVVIQHAGSITKPYVVLLNDADYIEFENVTIEQTGTNSGSAVLFELDCEHIVFDSCRVKGSTVGSSFSGALDLNAPVTLDYLLIEKCEITKGINFSSHAPGTDSARFIDNAILDGGLSVRSFSGSTVTGNHIDGVLGFVFSSNSLVEKNYLNAFIASSGSNNQTVRNNEVVRSTGGSAMIISSSNNVIYFNSVTSSLTSLKISGSNNDFMNNIFYSEKYCLDIDTTKANNFDYNVYYSEIDTLAEYNSGGYATKLNDLILSGSNSNSLVINPRFKSDTLIPRIADLETAGTPITGITTDIRDSTRNTTAPSIGAYEYTYVCDGLAGSYSIDPSGNGDYTSITAAVADLNSLGICNDVTFNIKKGTYVGQLQIGDIYNIGDSGRVEFQADPSNGVNDMVEVYDTIAGTGNGLVEISGQGYLEFNGLNFKFQSSSVTSSIFAFKADDEISNLTYRNCNFTRENNSLAFNTAVNGIDSLVIDSCTFNATKIQLNGGQKSGAYASITNSEFNEAGSSIEINFDYLDITDNTIGHDYGSGGNFTQLVQLQTDYLNYSRNIHRHRVGRHMVGLYLVSNHLFPGKMNITNNVFDLYSTVDSSSPHHDMGIRTLVNSADSVFIEHNTFQMGRSAGDNNGSALFLKGGSQVVRNNNIVVEYDGFGIQSEDAIASAYNNIYTLGDTISKINTTYYTTLAGMKVDGYDSNSVSVNPYFQSDTLLKPYRLALDNKGVSIAGITEDITGDTRGTTPDIGAYEFDPIVYDVLVDSVRVDTLCEGLHGVSAFIKNTGDSVITDLRFATSVQAIGGAVQESDILVVSNTLQPNDSMWVSTGNFQFAANLSYIVKARVDTINGYLDNEPNDNVSIDTLSTKPKPDAFITQSQACDGDSLRLFAIGGVSYEWFGPGGFTDSVANPKRGSIDSSYIGDYTVIAMDSNYCIDSATITLGLDTAPAINFPTNADSICDGFSKTISAEVNPFHTYLWNIGETSPNITVDSVYNYIVTVTNQNGCSSTDTFRLDTFSVPVLVFTDTVSLVCENSAPIPLNIASPAGGYYSSALVSGDTLYPSSFGVYPLSYIYGDTNTGCSAVIDTTFTIRKAPSVTISPLSAICFNAEVDTLIEHAPKGGSFFNSPAMTDSIYNPAIAGPGLDTISYQYSNSFGCSDTAYQTIFVQDTLAISLSDTSFCENKGSILLEQPDEVYAGISGSYSGSSALVGNYFRTGRGVPQQTLIYSVTDTNNCISRHSRTITIDTIPVVVFSDADICINAGIVDLNSATPSGGDYWGTGVVNDSLDPVVMGLGLDTIFYAYELPSNGCIDTAASLTYINPAPIVNLTLPDSTQERCENAIPAVLSGQSPLGGTFTGLGISSNGLQFLADTAGVGVHAITYSYTNSLGCESSTTDTIEVFGLPAVTFALYDSICLNSIPDTLTGGMPLGGFYSGSGVNSSGVYRPNLVGAKNAHTITYNFTDSVTGCANFSEQVVRIDSLTPIALGLIPDYCINVGMDTLNQGSINSGGFNYFGNGITNGNEFDPVLAGLGSHSIGYQFTNLKGCSDSLYQTIQVFDTSNVTLNIPAALTELCTNEAPFTLFYGLPLGGFYDTLKGIVGNQFNPAIAGPGSKTLRYTYSNANNCVTSKSQTIVVNSVPAVTHLADSFCFNEATQVLLNGLPTGGKYTGPGMINDSIFNPLFSGVGSTQITYTYTEPATGCSSSKAASYIVYGVPTVSLSTLNSVCENKSAFNLNAGSSNGAVKYYLGNGIIDTTLGTFSPSIAKSGSHSISYVGVSSAGCRDTITNTIKVDTIPIVTIDTLADLCEGAASFSLSIGKPSINGTGVYTGQGVSGKTYFPSVSGVGTDEIIYQFTDLNGCKESDTTSLTINALPNMVAAKWNSYCVGGDSIVLNGALPLGGLYSNALFVDSATQKIAIDSVGIWSVNYAYTDSNGCSNSVVQSLQVRDLPAVSLSFPSHLCSNSVLQQLSGGSPLGSSGVYKGDGVDGNFYNVDSLASNSDTLWYVYSDVYGCTDSAYQAIHVDTLTPITALGFSDLCVGGDNLNLVPYFTPSGGKFNGSNVIGGQLFTSLLSQGEYPITYSYTDSNNCKNSIIDTVYVRGNPVAILSNDTSMCTGESMELTVSGGLAYEWNTGERSSSIVVSPDTTSTYSVEVSNQFNCSVEEEVIVTVHKNFGVFTSSVDASCGANNGSGNVIIANGKAPIQYFWSTGDRNSSASGLIAGTYTITILDGNSCEQYASLDISNVGAPKISVDSIKNNLCYGAENGLISLNVQSSVPSKTTWSNGAKTNVITNLANGIYSISVKDSLGCSANKTFEINSPEAMSIEHEVISPLCDSANGNIIVFVEGGVPNYTYNWLGQSNTTDLLTNVGAGEYELVVSDLNQCSDTFIFNLNNVGGPELRLDSILAVDCGVSNGGIFLTSIDTVKSYLWSNGKTLGANSGIPVGTYTVTVTDTANCITTENFTVEYAPTQMASLCYVTFDTSNGGYNQLVWDTVGMSTIDGYSIYRESAVKGQYSLLGNIAKGLPPVFIDSSLNSQLAVGNYGIETYNACSNSESISTIHKSILLTTKEISNDIVQINWSGYQGINVSGYHVFRYSTTEGFKLLDSTAINVRSYNDYNAPKEESELFYFVIARGKDVCTPEGAIVSNFSRDFGTGIFIGTDQIISNFDFSVYPNPNKGEFNVKFNNSSSQPALMRVYNTQGQIVFEKTLNRIETEGTYSIKLRDISDGLYYLQLIGSGEIKTTQVIINQ
ncbi:MAG: right-handed parallel beta-helix repeat-containing protein [Salibacteraceae bacterium]